MKIDIILHDGISPVHMTIEDDIKEMRRLINCDTLQGLTGTEIGLLYGLDIYLDDNGKLYGQDIITGFFLHNNEVIDFLVGNLIIARHDEDGNTISVGGADLPLLARHLVPGECLEVDNDSKWKVAPVLLKLNC